MLWMLCGASYTLSIASAYNRTSPSASWGYQPLHGSTMSVNSSVYRGTPAGGTTITGTYTPASVQSGLFSKPTYRFHTTSAYLDASNVGGTRILMSEGGMMRSGWGDPNDDDDPIGSLKPTPVGDIPFVMMALMAGIYVIWKKKRKKIHELFAYMKKKQ